MTSARRDVYPYVTTRTEHVECTVITQALIALNTLFWSRVLSHSQPIPTIIFSFNLIRFTIYNPIHGYKRAQAALRGVGAAQLSELCGASSSSPPALLIPAAGCRESQLGSWWSWSHAVVQVPSDYWCSGNKSLNSTAPFCKHFSQLLHTVTVFLLAFVYRILTAKQSFYSEHR